ncbi:MAG: hypothetical protein ACRBB0_20875 [Pelagimonas sp.]|uniref:hypothetical protein n=1 Tax=Pelagimonas sp. TaxID=2073170 RepID=UPI003D6B5AA5
MTEPTQTPLPGGPEATAAEYVLGLLTEAERTAFEDLVSSDPDLQQDVAAWREYFSTFVADMPEHVPPPQVLRRIEAKLAGAPRVPLRKQIVPYVIGAVIGAVICWVALWAGVLPSQGVGPTK